MHIDRELVQGAGEVIAVVAVSLQGDRAQGVHENVIGFHGQAVLILSVVIPPRYHGLTGGAKTLDRCGKFRGLALANGDQAVELQHQRGDPLVLGGEIDRAYQVRQQQFPIHRVGVQKQARRIDSRALIEHPPGQIEGERGALGQRLRLLGQDHPEQCQQRNEQQVGEDAAQQRNRIPDSAQNTSNHA